MLTPSIRRTYDLAETFHFFRYIGEQAFRYNNREGTDAEWFELLIAGLHDHTIMLAKFTGRPVQRSFNPLRW